ncbi:MAG: CHASE2 domain-containing protein [Acidobacteriota bacterium]
MARKHTIGYLAVLGAAFVVAMLAGWLGAQIDNYAYDWMFRRHQPARRQPQSILLTVDEPTLARMGGVRRLREIVAEGLERIAGAGPKAVVIDVTLPEASDAATDARLEAAFERTHNLVLPCELVEGGRRWEDPIERFRRRAAALGHVHADPDPLDNVTRQVPLLKATGRERRWALALEAFRLSLGAGQILESPLDLEIDGVTIPTGRDAARPLRVRYLPPSKEGVSSVPRISIGALAANPALAERFRDKTVFVGVTAQSAARDRLMTPYSYGLTMQGIEIHANAFETLAGRQFLTGASEAAVAGFCLLLVAAAGLAFWFRSGWQAYGLAGALLLIAHTVPHVLFTRNVVFPYFAPVSAAWLAAVGAGAWQFLAVRRQWRTAEADKTRYQQAMHFVTHEMRTPLTAIQGSSELMTRYSLSEDKRRQIAELINAESRRLARMIETFLSVERLSAGQVELKRDLFQADELVAACAGRARPLAERKQIRLRLEPIAGGALAGDRELMEYVIYNLLTNAIKYSPAGTEVTVSGRREHGRVLISVRDQGMGMDRREQRKIFRKFYRTRRAEASGETGTGIGLSIVQQIVAHHGGTIEVTSQPGQGSCFTVVLPGQAEACAVEKR